MLKKIKISFIWASGFARKRQRLQWSSSVPWCELLTFFRQIYRSSVRNDVAHLHCRASPKQPKVKLKVNYFRCGHHITCLNCVLGVLDLSTSSWNDAPAIESLLDAR